VSSNAETEQLVCQLISKQLSPVEYACGKRSFRAYCSDVSQRYTANSLIFPDNTT